MASQEYLIQKGHMEKRRNTRESFFFFFFKPQKQLQQNTVSQTPEHLCHISVKSDVTVYSQCICNQVCKYHI